MIKDCLNADDETSCRLDPALPEWLQVSNLMSCIEHARMVVRGELEYLRNVEMCGTSFDFVIVDPRRYP